jgi:hypothetical protein
VIGYRIALLYPKSNKDLIVREPMFQENICEQVIPEELSHVLESSMFAQSDRQRTVREERTRIAWELHDTLLQAFLSASMQLGVAVDGLPSDSPVKPRLDHMLQLMDQGIKGGRNAIQGLRTESRAVDLVPAFSRLQQEIGVELKSIFASLSSAENSRCARGLQVRFTGLVETLWSMLFVTLVQSAWSGKLNMPTLTCTSVCA